MTRYEIIEFIIKSSENQFNVNNKKFFIFKEDKVKGYITNILWSIIKNKKNKISTIPFNKGLICFNGTILPLDKVIFQDYDGLYQGEVSHFTNKSVILNPHRVIRKNLAYKKIYKI